MVSSCLITDIFYIAVLSIFSARVRVSAGACEEELATAYCYGMEQWLWNHAPTGHMCHEAQLHTYVNILKVICTVCCCGTR